MGFLRSTFSFLAFLAVGILFTLLIIDLSSSGGDTIFETDGRVEFANGPTIQGFKSSVNNILDTFNTTEKLNDSVNDFEEAPLEKRKITKKLTKPNTKPNKPKVPPVRVPNISAKPSELVPKSVPISNDSTQTISIPKSTTLKPIMTTSSSTNSKITANNVVPTSIPITTITTNPSTSNIKEAWSAKGKGILNTGNICFASSAVQMLFRMDGIRESVLKFNNDSAANYELISGLKSLFVSLQDPNIKLVTDHQKKFIPQMFLDGHQHDSEEFYTKWMAILEGAMPQELKSQVLIEMQDDIKITKSDGTIENSSKIGYEYVLKVNFPENEASVPYVFKDLLVSPLGPFGTERVNEKISRSARLRSLPKYFSVAFIRSVYDFKANDRIKISSLVKIPELLDLSPYIHESFELEASKLSTKYRLKMFVLHDGQADGGHYVSYARYSPNSWYLLNDDRVSEVSNDKALEFVQSSSLCFFEQI